MMVMNDIPFWHIRFQQQSQWILKVRQYLFRKSNLNISNSILDVGCGTGVSLDGLRNQMTLGVDININRLLFAQNNNPDSNFSCANAHNLPIKNDTFDNSFCQFLLLWVHSPQLVLREMTRVTKPGGKIFAIAEPDYGGRIDFPKEFVKLGEAQTEGLIKQGANPYMGRELKKTLMDSGLENIEFGVINGAWSTPPSDSLIDLEWKVIESDLKHEPDSQDHMRLKEADRRSWQLGTRVLYIPTFYAIGSKPK